MVKKKSDFQEKILEVLKQRDCFGCTSTQTLAQILNSNRVAIASSCYSLMRQGLVLRHPPETQWDSTKWSLPHHG